MFVALCCADTRPPFGGLWAGAQATVHRPTGRQTARRRGHWAVLPAILSWHRSGGGPSTAAAVRRQTARARAGSGGGAHAAENLVARLSSCATGVGVGFPMPTFACRLQRSDTKNYQAHLLLNTLVATLILRRLGYIYRDVLDEFRDLLSPCIIISKRLRVCAVDSSMNSAADFAFNSPLRLLERNQISTDGLHLLGTER